MSVTGLQSIEKNAYAWAETIHTRTLAASAEIAQLLQGYAKANHPFQNQTGDTERTTTCTVRETQGVIQIILFSQTPYAQYLELAREGKWAWLRDAVIANKSGINRILAQYLGVRNGYDGMFGIDAADKRLLAGVR